MAKIYGDEKGAKGEWDKMKGEPLTVKLEWIIQYYGILILAVIFGIIAAISLIKGCIYNSIPNVITGEFQTAYMDAESPAKEEMKVYLCEQLGLNPDKYHIDLASSVVDPSDYELMITQAQRLSARIMAKELDFLAADEMTFLAYMDPNDLEASAFADLRTVMPEEIFSRLESEGRILYLEKGGQKYDYPYLIDIRNSEFFDRLGLVSVGECYMGITVNGEHHDNMIEVLKLIR